MHGHVPIIKERPPAQCCTQAFPAQCSVAARLNLLANDAQRLIRCLDARGVEDGACAFRKPLVLNVARVPNCEL
eukprot:3912898-Alexandrium_andersonii.AAC.1